MIIVYFTAGLYLCRRNIIKSFKIRKPQIRPIALVVLSFVLLIFAGSGLLCLPISIKSGGADYLTALFTATSATCVTGLSTVDAFGYYTGFGQAVILILIQIGGLGFITIISLFLFYLKKNVTQSDRRLVMQSVGGLQRTGLKSLLKCIFIGTFSLEFIGAFLLCFSFIPRAGWGKGIWFSLFTAVSSFCNAGFSLNGFFGDQSLEGFAGDPLVILVVCFLIVVGGIGFFVWQDILQNRFHVTRYSLHTKLVLTATAATIILSWCLYMLFEWNNAGSIGNMSAGEKVLNCLFCAVSPRTAGFSTVNMAGLSDAGYLLTIALMFIGGGSGSTAGGIKINTAAVLALTMVSVIRRNRQVSAYKRSIEQSDILAAFTVFILYLTIALVAVFVICGADSGGISVNGVAIDFKSVSFEVISAISATGLSMGITANLSAFSQVVIILLMFTGRIGGYTLFLLFTENRRQAVIMRISEHILIG